MSQYQMKTIFKLPPGIWYDGKIFLKIIIRLQEKQNSEKEVSKHAQLAYSICAYYIIIKIRNETYKINKLSLQKKFKKKKFKCRGRGSSVAQKQKKTT